MRHTAGLTYGRTKIPSIDQAYKKANMLDRGTKLNPMMSGMSSVPLVFQPEPIGATDRHRRPRGSGRSGLRPKARRFFRNAFQATRHEGYRLHVPQDKVDRFAVNYHYKEGRLSVKDAQRPANTWRTPLSYPAEGAFARLRTITRFLLMISEGGKSAKNACSRKTVRLMTTNQIPEGGGWVTFGNQIREGVGFGLGFSVRVKMSEWDPTGRIGEYGWGGAASTHYWISPKDHLVVLTLEQVMPYSFNTEWALKG